VKNRAFTLIELIIVIVIISMMSFLVFSENIKRTKRVDTITPLNLKEAILKKYNPIEGDIIFFCVNKCKECFILQNRKISKFEGNIRFSRDLEFYIVNGHNRLEEIEDFGTINDYEICFKFTIYQNSSSTKCIISDSSGVYFLPSYFGKPQEVKDTQIAKELWLREEFNLKDNANYY